jgi:hypothetical protein
VTGESALVDDRNPRETLAWGAAILVLGIALVGVGVDKAGAAPVLAGLLLTIFGIHTYGRLGPDGDAAGEPSQALRGAALAWGLGSTNVWRGGLVAVAGCAVVAGTTPEGIAAVTSYGAILAGGLVLVRGWRSRAAEKEAASRASKPSRKKRPKLEKRRRLDKSPPP